MQRSIFGVFTALLAVICILCAIPALRKKRYGLAVLLFLNAFTNIVNTIHAVYGTFVLIYREKIKLERTKWLEIEQMM